jgi:hypothetical protein
VSWYVAFLHILNQKLLKGATTIADVRRILSYAQLCIDVDLPDVRPLLEKGFRVVNRLNGGRVGVDLLAKLHLLTGFDSFRRGDIDQSLDHYCKVVYLNSELDQTPKIAAYNRIAEISAKQGKNETALTFFLHEISVYELRKDPDLTKRYDTLALPMHPELVYLLE